MIKVILSILMVTLFSGWNNAFGQESNYNCPPYIVPISYSEICFVESPAKRPDQWIAANELSSEELDQIIGEGPASFLINNDNQARILAEVILWDEIRKQRTVSMSGGIAMESRGGLINGVQVNGLMK